MACIHADSMYTSISTPKKKLIQSPYLYSSRRPWNSEAIDNSNSIPSIDNPNSRVYTKKQKSNSVPIQLQTPLKFIHMACIHTVSMYTYSRYGMYKYSHSPLQDRRHCGRSFARNSHELQESRARTVQSKLYNDQRMLGTWYVTRSLWWQCCLCLYLCLCLSLSCADGYWRC